MLFSLFSLFFLPFATLASPVTSSDQPVARQIAPGPGTGPRGWTSTVQGVQTYMVAPRGQAPQAIVVVLHEHETTSAISTENLFADKFADAGTFYVVSPRFLRTDQAYYNGNRLNDIVNVINHVRTDSGPNIKVVVTGYGAGGFYATKLAQNNVVQAASATYPKLLSVPADFQTLVTSSNAPYQLHNAALDTGFTPAKATQADTVLGNGNYSPGYQRTQFNGVGPGFAVKPDTSNAAQVTAKQQAFDATLAFFNAHAF